MNTNEVKDGGPAFPVSTRGAPYGHQDSVNTWQFPGMTLRDYFAAKAMHGLLSGDYSDLADKDAESGELVVDFVARTAYRVADAMIAARGPAATNAPAEQARDAEEWPGPDWSQVPEWARWWAVDTAFAYESYWYRARPAMHPGSEVWDVQGNLDDFAGAPLFGYAGTAAGSLRERPTP